MTVRRAPATRNPYVEYSLLHLPPMVMPQFAEVVKKGKVENTSKAEQKKDVVGGRGAKAGAGKKEEKGRGKPGQMEAKVNSKSEAAKKGWQKRKSEEKREIGDDSD